MNFFKPDPRLRLTYIWVVVGIFLIAGINLFSLTSALWFPMAGHTDKFYHAISYCVLMLWWLQLFPDRNTRIVLLVLFILMGVGLEVLQSFNPMRYLDYRDMIANGAGVLIAFVIGLTRLDQILYKVEQKLLSANN